MRPRSGRTARRSRTSSRAPSPERGWGRPVGEWRCIFRRPRSATRGTDRRSRRPRRVPARAPSRDVCRGRGTRGHDPPSCARGRAARRADWRRPARPRGPRQTQPDASSHAAQRGHRVRRVWRRRGRPSRCARKPTRCVELENSREQQSAGCPHLDRDSRPRANEPVRVKHQRVAEPLVEVFPNLVTSRKGSDPGRGRGLTGGPPDARRWCGGTHERRRAGLLQRVWSLAQASVRTSPRIPVISSNCSGPATSGGEIWITGSPRSSASADQATIVPPGREEVAEEPLALLAAERLSRLLVLDELERIEEADSAQVAGDGEVEEWARVERNRSSLSATCSTIRSRFMISMFLRATAH